jgi:uncharacterized Zn-binding protein involved in type VI secretion
MRRTPLDRARPIALGSAGGERAMGQPAARVGDMHVCPMVTPGVPPIPHVGGPILPTCSINVLTGGAPQARVSDKATCVGPPDVIVKGSLGVLVNKLPAARLGDLFVHGGTITVGDPTVLIGDVGGGGGGGGGMAKAGVGSGQGIDTSPLSSSAAYIQPFKQAAAYKNAAKAGTPFCERCA